MIRGLAIVAMGGAAVAWASISMSGALREKAWHFPDFAWHVDGDAGTGPTIRLTGNEPTINRMLSWAGGEKLEFTVPAHIIFTQGPTPAITITGPAPLANHVVLDGDKLRLDRHFDNLDGAHGLTIAITAPTLHEFDLESAQDLHIDHIDTDVLVIDISGAGNVQANGTAKTLNLTLEGLGNADLAALTLTDATIEIDGLGHVKAGPTGNARVEINGAGAVTLTRRPFHLSQEINGAGSIDVPPAPPGTTL